MPQRHRKTRTGCKQCKSRRVKCDEKRPFCSRCIRNELPCSLEFLTPTFPVVITEPSRHPITSALMTTIPGPNPSLKVSQIDPDLELMSHYTRIACLTLNNGRSMHVWQVDVPHMALSHDFLLMGILAFSALHLSTLQTSRKKELTQRASLFEQIALSSFRQFMSQDDPQNIHAVFAFAGFVLPYVLAQSGSLGAPSGRLPRLDDDKPHWFLVLRGLINLVERNLADLAKGPFSPTLARPVDPIDCNWNPDDNVLARICQLLEPKEASSDEDKQALAVCRAALHILRRVCALPYSPCRTLNVISGVYIWPGAIPKEFVDLLHVRRPEALVILAHYCVLLKKAESCWYLKGVGVKMLMAIESELDAAWDPWIRWALDQPVQVLEQE